MDAELGEITQRRESEEVEDIESSSEIASEDDLKEADLSESNECVDKVSDADDDQHPNKQDHSTIDADDVQQLTRVESPDVKNVDADDEQNGGVTKLVSQVEIEDKKEPSKDIDIEGELDYEEEIQGKEDESEGEIEEEEGEIEDDKKKQDQNEEKEEGERDDDEDEGEISDDDDELEEGEVKDSTSARNSQPRSVCRFFNKGQCTWGLNCRFIHPGINDKGNYNMFFPTPPSRVEQHNVGSYYGATEPPPANPPPPPPPPPPPVREEPSPAESAWERGLRQAKEIIKKSSKRKETDADFEEKRMNLSLVEGETQPEYDRERESDHYPNQSRPRNDSDSYYQHGSISYEESIARAHDVYDRRTYPSAGWQQNVVGRTGRSYEGNDHQQWPRAVGAGIQEYPYAKPQIKARMDEVRVEDFRDRGRQYPVYEKDRERNFKNQNRWRDERNQPIQPNRNAARADEWTDPWRRSKSPKGPTRRSRSKARSRRSYSSASSASFTSSRSSRSRSSSYSYSKSRSSSRSSRSRSYSYSPRPRRTPSKSPDNNSKVLPKSFSQTYNKKPVVATSNRKQKSPPVRTVTPPFTSQKKISAPVPVRQQPVEDKGVPRSRRRGRSPSWSGSGSSHSRSPPRYRSRSRSLSISSVSSISSSLPSLSGDESKLQKKTPQVVDKGRGGKPVKVDKIPSSYKSNVKARKVDEDHNKVVNKASKDPLKSAGVKPQIKLTLLKPATDKSSTVAKRKSIDEMLTEKQRLEKVVKLVPAKPSTGKKRPATSPSKSPTGVAAAPVKHSKDSSKKSTSSRREELLKQLRAVEDAIARKRTKF